MRGCFFPTASWTGDRSAHLRRYAFVGDSYTFGQGVAAWETLPARCERYLNELTTWYCYETVNLGVCGYNLWNSWTRFKRCPSTYDGLILTLCSNDAQLLQHSFQLSYQKRSRSRNSLWDPKHPFRGAIVSCFDEMAQYHRARRLPMAVCYYNLRPSESLVQIGRWIAALCEERDFLFVDFFERFSHLAPANADLTVSRVDLHPSAHAHDLAGRQLALALHEAKWLAAPMEDLLRAPTRIISIVNGMMNEGGYDSETTLDWGRRALEGGERGIGRRLSGARLKSFRRNVVKARDRLDKSHASWHAIHARAAYVAHCLLDPTHGVEPWLRRLEAEMLKAGELSTISGLRNLASTLTALPSQIRIEAVPATSTSLDDCRGKAVSAARFCRTLLKSLEQGNMVEMDADLLLTEKDRACLTLNTACIAPILTRVINECSFAQQIIDRIRRLDRSPSSRFGPEKESVFRLTAASLARSIDCVTRICNLVRVAFRPVPRLKTGIVFEIAVRAIGGRPEGAYTLCVCVRPEIPRRVMIEEWGYFGSDEPLTVLRFKFPVFYAGIVSVCVAAPPFAVEGVTFGVVKASLLFGDSKVCPLSHELFPRFQANQTLSVGAYIDADDLPLEAESWSRENRPD